MRIRSTTCPFFMNTIQNSFRLLLSFSILTVFDQSIYRNLRVTQKNFVWRSYKIGQVVDLILTLHIPLTLLIQHTSLFLLLHYGPELVINVEIVRNIKALLSYQLSLWYFTIKTIFSKNWIFISNNTKLRTYIMLHFYFLSTEVIDI